MEGLYPGIHETDSRSAGYASTPTYNPASYEQFRANMNRFGYEMQRPDGAKRRKKKKNAEKKLKHRMRMLEFLQEQRMRELEAEHDQMKQFFQMVAIELSMIRQQRQSQHQASSWWHGLLGIGIGKAFDMGGIALNNWTKKRPQIALSDKKIKQLMLADGSDRK